jgi:hypothetical protein
MMLRNILGMRGALCNAECNEIGVCLLGFILTKSHVVKIVVDAKGTLETIRA